MDFYGKEFYRGLPDDESEDCLYLNIWTPASATAQSRLPVLFWIHGGAFLHGCGSERSLTARLCQKGRDSGDHQLPG